MPTVDATVGEATANSYVTVADADAYFAETFGRPLWGSAATEDKEALVITASRTLDQYISWNGIRASTDQTMEWPRYGAYDRAGYLFSTDEIPISVKAAVYELAYYILSNGALSFVQQQIDRVRVGPITVNFNEHSTDPGIPNFIESLVTHLGYPVLTAAGSVTVARLQRS